MPDINTESMAIAPGVVETIVTLAVRDVAGVASVGAAPSGICSLLSFKQSVQGVSVNVSHDNTVDVAVSLRVQSGRSLTKLPIMFASLSLMLFFRRLALRCHVWISALTASYSRISGACV